MVWKFPDLGSDQLLNTTRQDTRCSYVNLPLERFSYESGYLKWLTVVVSSPLIKLNNKYIE